MTNGRLTKSSPDRRLKLKTKKAEIQKAKVLPGKEAKTKKNYWTSFKN